MDGSPLGGPWFCGKLSNAPDHDSEHIVFVPALLGWAWRSRETGEEVEFLGGAGPALMALTFGAREGLLWAGGVGFELGVNYIHALSAARRLALVVGVSARLVSASVQGGSSDSYFQHADVFHREVPGHVGLRF